MAENTKNNKAEKDMITKDMNFAEILKKKPAAAEVMFKNGLHCGGCHAAAFETMEQGAMAHGMSEEDVEKMLEEINKL